MEFVYLAGIGLVVCGGVMEGTFSLPMRYTPKWKWENIWGASSLAALVLVPWPLALATVPNLFGIYGQADWKSLFAVIGFGFGWALGSIFYGLGVNALGFSIGLSLIMGLIAIGGSVIPLAIRHPDQLSQPAGLFLFAGIAVMAVGMVLCGKAGRMTELAHGDAAGQLGRPAFRLGLLYCVLCGLLSAFVNFALIFGEDLAVAARSAGAGSAAAANVIWAPVFTVNYVVNIGYCLILNRRNRSFRLLFVPGASSHWLLAVGMGLVWAGGIVVYGAGAQRLGSYGTYFGFPMMLISSIFAGNFIGVLAGEWKGIGKKPRVWMVSGLCFLTAAIAILTYSSLLVQ